MGIIGQQGASGSALYLLSAPMVEMNMDLVKELGTYMSDIAPNATIRYGDYPRKDSFLKITLILSQLNSVTKVREYFQRMPDLMKERKKRLKENEAKIKELIDASETVPSLFD